MHIRGPRRRLTCDGEGTADQFHAKIDLRALNHFQRHRVNDDNCTIAFKPPGRKEGALTGIIWMAAGSAQAGNARISEGTAEAIKGQALLQVVVLHVSRELKLVGEAAAPAAFHLDPQHSRGFGGRGSVDGIEFLQCAPASACM